MKNFILLILLLLIANILLGQTEYDSTLAKKLNADDYGMKYYVMVFLKTGSNKITDKNKLDSLFAGHMANIKKLGEEGSLVVAGPFGKNEEGYRGLFIFNVTSIEKAKELVETDPTVASKIFDAEYFLWYGSAALQEVTPIHMKIQKLSF